ncbi:MAG: sulfatase-like hydrolase/transferase, partial [Polyangiaceae bacterium]
MRFGPVPKTATGQPLAEIDWIHIGSGDVDPSYAAPTRTDFSAQATIGGVSKESIAVRGPGFLRCIGWIPKAAKVSFSAGIQGNGDADVEVRLLQDRSPTKVLQKLTVQSTQGWTTGSPPVEIDASDPDGTLGAIEFAVTRASNDVRVVIGEPRVEVLGTAPLPPEAPARGVILVVLGDISLRALRLYGGQSDLPALGQLAEHALIFDQHRAGTTFASGTLASMLTGRSARAIKMDGPDARLPRSVVTVADAARQGGVVTGFFSANPTTQEAFGFDRSWETMISHSPDESPSTTVFDDAATFIDAHKADRFLVVVHARGGHPPWDSSPDELKSLPPANYMGSLDPRQAGELLAR